MACELTNLEARCVACHHDVVVWTPPNDNLRLIGSRTSFISSLVVNCIFQLATICCDLKKKQNCFITKTAGWGDFLSTWADFLNLQSVKSFYHGTSKLLRQFPVVRFRESRVDQLCMSENFGVLKAHSTSRLHSVGLVHQGENRLLGLQRQLQLEEWEH